MGLRKSYIISKSFRSYLLATLLTLVIGQVCLTTDGIIMSHLISPDALSAINLMSPFNMIMATVHALLAIGASVLAGKELGAQNTKAARQIFSVSIYSGLVTILVIAIACLIFQADLVRVLCPEPRIQPYLTSYLGGKLCEVISGGAAINRSIEQTLRDLKFPLTEAYGATECAPMITFSDYKKKRQCSCGTAVTGMELRVDSPHPHTEAGEILARGGNTMLGYYKNPEATALALDADGWYHTGDNGVIDDDGYLFIRGRKKNMLLGPNGQNIYPEEIEDQLNTLLLVSESLVVQRDSQLVALVHPDYDEANELGLSDENIRNIMKLNATDINELIPSYEHIHHIEIHEDEFEKTAKKTLKRYLYR